MKGYVTAHLISRTLHMHMIIVKSYGIFQNVWVAIKAACDYIKTMLQINKNAYNYVCLLSN
jgi:hypothetical protein